jgi:Signal peptidase, peptidase S26
MTLSQTTRWLESSICIVDETRKVCRAMKVMSHPVDLVQALKNGLAARGASGSRLAPRQAPSSPSSAGPRTTSARLGHDDIFREPRGRAVGANSSCSEGNLERQCECAGRTLRDSACEHAPCHRVVGGEAARAVASFLAERHYLPKGLPLLKRILALPGQKVCRSDLTITVDGIAMGDALDRDSRGRQLPVWRGCHVIVAGEVFLMNWQSEDSLDGRYFGFLSAGTIIGRADPLWTREGE